MALSDTFIKGTTHTGKPSGDEHSDGGGMYLHANCWPTGSTASPPCSPGATARP